MYSYTAAFATNDFFTNNATWNVSLNLNPGGTNLELLRETGSGFEKLNRTECIQRYMSPFNSGKDLIVVTNWTDNKRSLHDGTSLITAFQNPLSGPDWDTENIWLCFDNGTWPKTCNTKGAAIMATNWTVNNDYYSVSDGRWSAPVDYCLSAGTNLANVNCGFHWSITIMALVSALNFVKLICIVLVARWTHKSSLVSNLFPKKYGP